MQESDIKNTIVLKNIPSNIIEEAIIVLKENKKAGELETIENKNKISDASLKPIKRDYVVKEAELVLSDYIDKTENGIKSKSMENNNLKYRRLKKYAYISTFIMFIQFLMSLCN